MAGGARRGRGALLLAAGLLSAGLALATSAAGVLDGVERASVDARFAIRGTQRSPRDVALVAIDGPTLSALRVRFPFSRVFHAGMVRRLVADGARVIAYDVQFTEPGPGDTALLDAVAAAPRDVVLVTTEEGPGGSTNVFGGDSTVRSVGARVGDGTIGVDPGGVLRRFQYSNGGLTSFSVVAAELAGHRVTRAPFGSGGAWIDYAEPDGTIPTYSFSQVLDGRVPAGALRGRVVVVGATAPTLGDIHATPTTSVMPGPEVEANMIETILRRFPLRSTGGWLAVLATLLMGVLAPSIAWRRAAPWAVLAGLAAAGVFVVAAQLAFGAGWIVPVAEPLLALALGTIGAITLSAAFAAVDRERTRTLFARFVPAAVVDEVLARAGGDVRLGGTRVQATVVFCDLRGSTALIAALGAERGIDLLNRYLTEMTDAVLAHGGTLAGFRGDGLLALFGAPLEQPDHAQRAVAAGREMIDVRLQRVNAWARPAVGEDLRIGIGICSGEVMAGNVGSEQRMEYTAIGDAANIAARLEALTKESGHQMYVADSTHALLNGDHDGLRDVGELEVRGAQARVRVWAPAIDPTPGA